MFNASSMRSSASNGRSLPMTNPPLGLSVSDAATLEAMFAPEAEVEDFHRGASEQ